MDGGLTMNRRWAVLLGVVGVGLYVAWRSLGLSGAYIADGPRIAAGIGAKLLCSAEYVSGMSRAQAFDDVRQYSALLEHLDVSYDPVNQSVSASLLGMGEKRARYIEGLGCALDFSGLDARTEITVRPPNAQVLGVDWPRGNRVSSLDTRLQAHATALVRVDNEQGFNTRALLVVKDGHIVAEAYAQGADSTTPLLGWSMAKSLTAIMLGNLELRGLIDLSAPPPFPSWRRDARSTINMTHMLNMTDGLGFTETYEPGDDATTMLFDVPSAADYALQASAVHTPGQRFNYSSGTANLLARVYQDTLGSPQAAYDAFMDFIVQPMGLEHSTFELDPSGTFMGSSYVYASARDWARMGQLMLNDGVLNDQQIVSSDWIARATAPNASMNNKAYGYQWWLNRGDEQPTFPDLPEDAYFASGNRAQTVMVIPSLATVIVRLGWTDGPYPLASTIRQLLAAIDKGKPGHLR